MKLQKFLAEAGLGSRRKCEDLIKAGRIWVNGSTAVLGQKVAPLKNSITLDGKILRQQSYDYFILYKPKGYLSTVHDPQKRATILDLVRTSGRIYPVGRLDKDSEGLMLLTNDGDLAYCLTHPKFEVKKTYEVLVAGSPPAEILRKIEKGILLEDGMTAPCEIGIINSAEGKKKTLLEIKIHEGKKREIRRMMRKAGYDVISLCRTALGPLKLSGLSPGEWRSLTKKEVQDLRKHAQSHVR